MRRGGVVHMAPIGQVERMIATIIGILAVAAWLYLIVFRGMFWRVRDEGASSPAHAPTPTLPRLRGRESGARASDGWGHVVAVVPARDEADVIGRAVGPLLAQDYRAAVHIIVIHDHSGDGTAAI